MFLTQYQALMVTLNYPHALPPNLFPLPPHNPPNSKLSRHAASALRGICLQFSFVSELRQRFKAIIYILENMLAHLLERAGWVDPYHSVVRGLLKAARCTDDNLKKAECRMIWLFHWTHTEMLFVVEEQSLQRHRRQAPAPAIFIELPFS